MIEIKNVSKHFGGIKAVENVTLNINKGSITGLIGPNGAGKSSLMHAILGLVPSTGSVEISGYEVSDLPLSDLAKNVAFVPQEPVIPDGMKVFDYVLLGRIHNLGFFAQMVLNIFLLRQWKKG